MTVLILKPEQVEVLEDALANFRDREYGFYENTIPKDRDALRRSHVAAELLQVISKKQKGVNDGVCKNI